MAHGDAIINRDGIKFFGDAAQSFDLPQLAQAGAGGRDREQIG